MELGFIDGNFSSLGSEESVGWMAILFHVLEQLCCGLGDAKPYVICFLFLEKRHPVMPMSPFLRNARLFVSSLGWILISNGV